MPFSREHSPALKAVLLSLSLHSDLPAKGVPFSPLTPQDKPSHAQTFRKGRETGAGILRERWRRLLGMTSAWGKA